MSYFDEPYRVLVTTNEDGLVTSVNSSAFVNDESSWKQVDSGYGDKYYHAQGNYFPNTIVTEGGAYRYKLVDNVPIECSDEEIIEQEEANRLVSKPTADEIIEARLTYVEMMTGLLEE